MRFVTVAAVVLIAESMSLAQQPKPKHYVSPALSAPAISSPTPAAAQLARIEQQTAHLQLGKPVTHAAPTVKATPALDLGKNKPVRVGRPLQPTNHH